MPEQFDFSVVARFRDLASAKMLSFSRKMQRGFRGGLLTLPMKLMAGFTRLIPGIGGVMSGVVGTASNILGGLVNVVGNIVGSMVNAFSAIVKGFVRIAQRAVGAVAAVLGKITKIAGAVGVGAAVAFGVFLRQVGKSGDAIAKMAKRTGLGVGFLSEMQHVLELNDAKLSDLQTAMRGLGRAVEGAMRGSKEYLEVWQRLGVSLRDRNGQIKNSEELFLAVARALGRVENRALRMGMAQRLFGRSGERMLALIAGGDIAGGRREARRFGLGWTPEQAQQAERMLDSFTRLRAAWRGLRKAFLAPFMRPVARLMERLSEALAGNRDRVKAWGRTAAEWFGRVADWAGKRLPRAFHWLLNTDFGAVFKGLHKAAGVAARRIGRLFADQLPSVLIKGFRWAVAEIKLMMQQLWNDLGRGAAQHLLLALGKGFHGFNRALNQRIDEQVAEYWDKIGRSPQVAGENREPFGELSRRDKQKVRDWYARRHPILDSVFARMQKMAGFMGQTATDAAGGMEPEPGEDAAKVERLRGKAQEKQKGLQRAVDTLMRDSRKGWEDSVRAFEDAVKKLEATDAHVNQIDRRVQMLAARVKRLGQARS